ncbi:MAG: hypothetical protein ABH850_06640 [Candidatus Micrarchaeota archaeon]
MDKKEKILPKEFVKKQFEVKEPEMPEEFSAKVHSYKGIFTRVNLPKKLVKNMDIKDGDTLRFKIRKDNIKNKERLLFETWVEK